MFATQYAPNTSGSVEIAVPDKFIKFISRGWEETLLPPFGYPVWLDTRATVQWPANGGSIRTVLVNDVGPHNEDDNWMDGSPTIDGCRGRRMFSDIPRCFGEAWKAFYNGYNGGRDQFGFVVPNPGEVDLSLAFASSLGLAYLQNDFVNVTPLWHGC